jgi:N-acetylneuraminic acid mutarotase
VEKYDISHNQWSMVRSMHMARSDAGVATLKGNIYVVGGFDGVVPTNTAEVFCPGTGRWSIISPMRVARSGVKVVAMDGLLYVVGGWDGQQRLRSGEMYNPDTMVWSDLPDMKTPRSNHSLAVVQGRLVVMGGYQGTETTKKVEVLDMSSNTWEEVGELSTSRSGLASGVVTFNNLDEEAREGLRWQQDDKEGGGQEMDGVEGDTKYDIFMEYGEDSESDFSDIYDESSDDSDMIVE